MGARDEAAHGAFGWTFLEWAGALLDEAARAHLSSIASAAIDVLAQMYRSKPKTSPREGEETLGWLPASVYREIATRELETRVRAPLRAHGIAL